MGYVALIDRPGLKVQVRDDIASEFSVCDACDGAGSWSRTDYYNPDAMRCGGIYMIATLGAYVCGKCDGRSIIRKPPAEAA